MFGAGTILLASHVASPFVGTASAQAAMTANQFKAKVVGKTLVAKRFGRAIQIVYSSNGTVKMNTPLGPASGNWVFRSGKLCTNITQGPRTGNRCGALVDLGGGRFRGDRGTMQIAR
ncbi:MAG: hypothetical protein AAFO73_06970 [Pseudomonadota bacterium]